MIAEPVPAWDGLPEPPAELEPAPDDAPEPVLVWDRLPELPRADRLRFYDMGAERAVLGSILVDGPAIADVLEHVTAEDFSTPEHRAIFAAMRRCYEAGIRPDVVTLADVSDPAYLAQLVNATPTSIQAEQYAALVAAASRRRQIAEAAGRIAEAAQGGAGEDELSRRIADLTLTGATTPVGSPTARLGGRLLSEIPTTPAAPTLLDRLDPEGSTVLFGEGGVGKGVEAASWIVGLVGLGYRVLLVDYEGHPGEWARRIGTLGGRDVSEAVMYVMPAGPAWQGVRGPLWAQADDLRRLADEHGATYMVVDSAVPACGATDPLKPEAASQYAMGLERIGRPALTLAHVTKAGDGRMPFGSAFWHNLSRVTWSLERDGETLILNNRKANSYAWLGRFAVTFTWHDGALGEVSERSYSLALADMLAEVLANGPLTVAEICAQLDPDEDGAPPKADSIRKTLRRGCPEHYRKVGDRWALA